MVWPFCPNCHNTLSVNASGDVNCAVCNHATNLSTYSAAALPSRTTTSADRPVPLWAKSDEEQAARQSQTDGTVRWSKDGNGAGRYVVEFKPE